MRIKLREKGWNFTESRNQIKNKIKLKKKKNKVIK